VYLLSTLHQVGVVHALQVQYAVRRQHWTQPFKAVFDAPHHPYRSGEVCVCIWHARSSDYKIFPPSIFHLLLEKCVDHCKKKKTKKKKNKNKTKKVRLFVCYVKLGSHSFDCNIFGFEWFIELILFFNLIHWHLIYKLDLVLILLITLYLEFNNLSS
jgi:hypothetical protein